MHIPDPLYKALIDYLARKPWHEVNTLITALANANSTGQKQIESPRPIQEADHGN
jgi:hypothetical protein